MVLILIVLNEKTFRDRDTGLIKFMSALLDLDMNCRRLFANVYGGSDLKYNSQFDQK